MTFFSKQMVPGPDINLQVFSWMFHVFMIQLLLHNILLTNIIINLLKVLLHGRIGSSVGL